MNYNNLYLTIGAILLLAVGLFVGSTAFPQEVILTETKTVEVVKEVPVEIVKIEEVLVEDTKRIGELELQLSQLAQRYEQRVSKEYDAELITRELALISQGMADFEADYKHLVLRGFLPSQVTFNEWYDQKVYIDTVDVLVNGVEREFDEVRVVAETRVRYEDENGVSFITWEVEIEYTLDNRGNVLTSASASRI